jgi:hypothetical protein
MPAAVEHELEMAEQIRWRDRWTIFAAGVVVLTLATGILALFGEVSEASRATVLEGLNDSLLWLAGALIGACATITALMLTTLSLMPHLETHRLSARFLYNLKLTVRAGLGTIALAVLCLLLSVFPSAGTEQFTPSQTAIDVLYFTTLSLTALMIGSFAVVLSALYQTIADILRYLPEEWVEDILTTNDDVEAETRAGRAVEAQQAD